MVSGMPLTKRLTIETVDLDDKREMNAFDQQVIEAGMQRVRLHRAELRAKGLLSADGQLLITDLPEDMKLGSERDFGG